MPKNMADELLDDTEKIVKEILNKARRMCFERAGALNELR